MKASKNNIRFYINAAFSLLSLVLLVDYLLPGNAIQGEVVAIKSERQDYNNAGGNSHLSYTLVTQKHQFSVEEEFARNIEKHKKVEYYVSYIFKEINSYKKIPSENISSYSLRTYSGCIVPLLTLVVLIFATFYRKNIDIITFVFQALLLGDLIYVLL